MENKRMTWDEIVAKYPDRWVGLTDVERGDGGSSIISAVVKYPEKSHAELFEKQIRGELYTVYTTPENLLWNIPLGALSIG